MKKLHPSKSQLVRIIWTLITLLILSEIIPAQIALAGNDVWTSTGILGAEIWAIEVNPNNPQELLVGISSSSNVVYRSIDGGASWMPSSSGITVSAGTCYDIAYDVNNSNRVYAATRAGVYKSLNGGLSWQQVGPLTSFFSIETDPVNGNVVYAGVFFSESFPDVSGIWKSTDGGSTWVNIFAGPIGNVRALEIAPSAPHVLYAGGEMGLYKSNDSGQTWENAEGGFVTLHSVMALAVDPHSSDIVYMEAMSALYKTTDGGDSWIPISAGLGSTDVRAIEIDPGNQQIIYVGAASSGGGTPGVYRSTDSLGTSWVPMNAGMGSTPILSLAIDNSNPQNIYAGSTSSGVWKYTFVTSGPADYSISINNGALFANQASVTLNLTAPPGTAEMMISNDGGFPGASWETFINSKAWTITSYGSYVIPRTVYAKFKTYGQVSGLYQDDIILDVTPPVGTVNIVSVGLNPSTNNQQSVTTDSFTLSSPVSVELQLNATDDVSGVGEMMISSHSDFSGASWEQYSVSKTWQTDTIGAVTVYVKFKDNAGNLSSVVCDTNGTTPCAGSFSDVFPDYWAWSWIERLYSAGITGGCSTNPLNYCPDNSATRAQMAVFLLRGVHGSAYTPPAVGASTGFNDVPLTHWAAAWIKQLAAEGITGGCGTNLYCPEDNVTRAQMAVFLLKSEHGSSYTPPALGGSTGFDDVALTHWAAAWIKQLSVEGITGGCGTNLYCPENPVTRAQMAVFLVRTFNLP